MTRDEIFRLFFLLKILNDEMYRGKKLFYSTEKLKMLVHFEINLNFMKCNLFFN